MAGVLLLLLTRMMLWGQAKKGWRAVTDDVPQLMRCNRGGWMHVVVVTRVIAIRLIFICGETGVGENRVKPCF